MRKGLEVAMLWTPVHLLSGGARKGRSQRSEGPLPSAR